MIEPALAGNAWNTAAASACVASAAAVAVLSVTSWQANARAGRAVAGVLLAVLPLLLEDSCAR